MHFFVVLFNKYLLNDYRWPLLVRGASNPTRQLILLSDLFLYLSPPPFPHPTPSSFERERGTSF